MAKKYTRKQVSSLSELDLEQERIKYKARRIEDDMLDIFSPQQLAITAVSAFLRRKKKKPAPVVRTSVPAVSGKPGKKRAENITGTIAGFAEKPLVKKLARKAGISFLRWQAFNLAFFIGKKIYRSIREKRAANKLQHR